MPRAFAPARNESAGSKLLKKRAGSIQPFLPAFLELGRQLGEIGRFDEGIAVLESGLALKPDALDLRMGLGYLHLKRNDRGKARALFLEVLAATPGRHETLVALAAAPHGRFFLRPSAAANSCAAKRTDVSSGAEI